jgi:hypothetical protein
MAGESQKYSDEYLRQLSRQFMRRLMDQALLPNLELLVRIRDAGDIAVAVFEMNENNKGILPPMGWDGKAVVFPLPNDYRKRLAAISDTVTAAWLMREPSKVLRVLVWTGIGSLLLNIAPKRGYWLEPGSLDDEFV